MRVRVSELGSSHATLLAIQQMLYSIYEQYLNMLAVLSPSPAGQVVGNVWEDRAEISRQYSGPTNVVSTTLMVY